MDLSSPESKTYVLKKPVDGDRTTRLSREYAQELNPQQLAAVEVVDGPALVIAGAGSGKTRALVYRVARLIDLGIDPRAILLLTFTRKAAQEMLGRVGLLIGIQSEHVAGGTFHSTANLLLRRYGRSIGLEPGFTILDRGDSEDLVNLLRAQFGLHETGKRFPRKRTIVEMFSKCANTCQNLETVMLNEYEHFGDYLGVLTTLQEAYEAAKRQRQLVDYDDLLVRLRELLTVDEQARQLISNTYRYLLVDEYQDTNRLQADVIRKLAATHDNVMVVGDDSQSIYAFRGATIRNIMEFPTFFPGTTIYKLEENYRSTPAILQVANSIIEEATEKYSKTLFTQKLDGPRPSLIQAMSENAQSRFVAQKILELREEGTPLRDIAVLFRSSFHAFDLEIELSRRDIPFIKRGGFKFIETAHVKDLLAHLRIVHNPLDAVSWNRTLLLVEGVGQKKSKDLIELMINSQSPIETLRSVGGRPSQGLRNLATMLELVSSYDTASPAEQISQVLEYYLPILKDQYDDYPKRIRDLEHLSIMADRYAELGNFLADLTLEPPDQSMEDREASERNDERLILSTIHSAKGLEWRCVFLLWLVDGRFPSSYSFVTDEDLEEERRLLYVAVTRAKQELYLTYPINVYDKMTGSVLSKPSRFLETVPSSFMETWNLVEEEDLYA
ncbi:MAG: AAA family ATPase [Nitrospirales bacterium]|nr:AAA family ATPase [Nitrospirales bacterium]